MPSNGWEFGPFRYDPAQRLLFRDGALVPLVPKAVETLHALLERRGRIVEKAELMKLVWPDATVEEIGLARNVSTLRKALGDETDANLYIETIPRRGYRFIAEVRDVTEGVPPLPMPTRPRRFRRTALVAVGACAVLALLTYWQFYRPSRYLPSGPGFAELAVAPFDCASPELNRSGAPKDLNEMLAASLSQLDRVHVISPTTVRKYDRLGIPMNLMSRMLGLQLLVEGSLRTASGRLRVTARLVDVHSGKLVWSNSADYPAADVDLAESAAARDISAAVDAHVRARPSAH
jgi:DNA-binding winged helix-turn-helix (wHTH) protein/TolB-like protein